MHTLLKVLKVGRVHKILKVHKMLKVAHNAQVAQSARATAQGEWLSPDNFHNKKILKKYNKKK